MENEPVKETQETQEQIPTKTTGIYTNCLYYSACKSSGVSECGYCPEFRPRGVR
jgi:hypothetical protein